MRTRHRWTGRGGPEVFRVLVKRGVRVPRGEARKHAGTVLLHLCVGLFESRCTSAKTSRFPLLCCPTREVGAPPEAKKPGLLMCICCLSHCGTEAGWLLSREPAATGGVDAGTGGRSAGFLSLLSHQKTK